MNRAFITVAVAVFMEPASAAIHRYYGHGAGWKWHRSHHEPGGAGPALEANDAIPIASAGVTMAAFALGTFGPRIPVLRPIATGMTLYGAAYAIVHDIYIHRRIPLLPERIEALEGLREAHLRHHRTGSGDWGIFWSW